MSVRRSPWWPSLAAIALAATCAAQTIGFAFAPPQKKDKKKDKAEETAIAAADDTSKKGKKSKKGAGPSAAPTSVGTPALWSERGEVSGLNLFYGIGGEAGMPKPPFTFDKEDLTGTNPKIKVVDADGVKWNVKFDEEVHAEIASSRFAWASGYMVEESYFVPSARVSGVTGLSRAKSFVGADGSISNAIFEKRPDHIARRRNNWSWDSNPFVGSKELSGLAILNALLSNWDAKVANNNILGMYDADGQTVKEWYVVADWGGTFGKMGGAFSHTKWNPAEFGKQQFLDGVSGNTLRLHYSGKMSPALKTIPLEHARWFAGIVGQLSDSQIRDAFKAAGASPAETEAFAGHMRLKINELKTAVGR
jgi:hypothetical protein